MKKFLIGFIAGAVILGSTSIAYAVGAFPIATGGTGATTFLQGLIYSPGGTNVLSATSSGLTIDHIFSTSTTATSTYAHGVKAPCFSVDGISCIGTTGSGTVTNIATTWPVIGGPITTTGTLSFGGVATSAAPAIGNLAYWTSDRLLGTVATTAMSVTAPITFSGTIGAQVGGGAGSFGCTSASNGVTGCMTATDWGLLHTATSTFSSPLVYTSATNAVTCPTCNVSSATVTSITGGTGLAGGTITTSGTLALVSYLATSTAETIGQVAYAGSTNGTPAKLAFVSTTTINFSAAYSTSTVLGYLLGGSSGVVSSVIQPSFTYSTSTAWTGTTTIPLQQLILGETINGVRCSTAPGNGGTLNVQFGNGTASTTMLNASSTNNFNAFTSNNTPTAGQQFMVEIGTPASSPTKINCTVKTTI